MELDRIIKELNKIKDEKQKESEICTRGRMNIREMVALSKGYSMAINDLTNMIGEQNPPNTGSSVQKEEVYKFKKGNNVVTKDGRVRNLIYANKVGTEWYIIIFDSGKNTKSEHIITDSLEKDFDRIGEYDFTKKNIIENIDLTVVRGGSSYGGIVCFEGMSNEDLLWKLTNKMNEIIDCLNKEEK